MNTKESNKLIAEFMGYDYVKHGDISDGTSRAAEDYLAYDTDWNWLMEVVDKIESLNYSTETRFIAGLGHIMKFLSGGASVPTSNRVGEDKKEAVYSACVQFIQWYNQSKN